MSTRGGADLGDLWERPIIVAPMGGGPSTPTLVAAAAEAGAFGFLAAAYKRADEVAAEIDDVRARTSKPFGVNVFVPGAPTPHRSALHGYMRELERDAASLGVDLGPPRWDDDDWTAKVELLVDTAPAVCSFTFGCPDRELVETLTGRGSSVMVTATSVREADAALAAGADIVCVQGIEAGAHRGTFDDDEHADPHLTTLGLVAAVRARSSTMVVAAGGIATPAQARAAVDAGAAAVQCGTAFLRCDESAATALHKAALVDPAFTTTAFTRAFTGRRARGLVNRFMRDHPAAPRAYPEIHHVTRPLRAAAVCQDDAGGTNLWAGTGHRQARTGPAAEIVDWLAQDL